MTLARNLLIRLFGSAATAVHRMRVHLARARRHMEGLRKIAAMDSSAGPHRLHLGCGHVYKPGWINIDEYFIPPCTPDVTLDLRRGLPFPEGSCSEVYSEHFFEHIPYPEGAEFNLRECLRILRPGGVLSIGVPDPRPVLEAYLAGDTSIGYYDYFFKSPYVRRHLATPMEAVNWLFRQGGEHQFIYDFETLSALLTRNGFLDIRRREWDAERDSAMRRGETLYLDCRKPFKP